MDSGLHWSAGRLYRPPPSPLNPPPPADALARALCSSQPWASPAGGDSFAIGRLSAQYFTPPFRILPHQRLLPSRTGSGGRSGGLTDSVMTRGQQVACLEVDGHLTKELLYRYRGYRLHTNGAGIGRPGCNSSVESDPQRRCEPEDLVDGSSLASCK